MTEGAFFWSSAPASPPSPSTSGVHGMDGCIDGHVCGCTSINETVLYTISVVGSENAHTLLWCFIDGVLTIAFLRWGFQNRILVRSYHDDGTVKASDIGESNNYTWSDGVYSF